MRKFNDGDDGSLPDTDIKANRMRVPDWLDAAHKTQRNQREYMEHVGPKARRTQVIVRDAPVFITTDTSDKGCGVLEIDGTAIPLKKSSNYGYLAKQTKEDNHGLYLAVKSTDENGNEILQQCVRADVADQDDEKWKAKRENVMKVLARIAAVYRMKDAIDTNSPLSMAESAQMVRTVNELQNNTTVQKYLYDDSVPKDEAIKKIAEKLQKVAGRFPRLMRTLLQPEDAKGFATKMYKCAQQTKGDTCAQADCGWLPFQDPQTGETTGICFPGKPDANGSVPKEDTLIEGKTVGDLVNLPRLTVPQKAALEFWQEENRKVKADISEEQKRIWRRVNPAMAPPPSPSAGSRLGLTLGGGGGGDVPSVFSTATSDASSAWSAGNFRVF